jgi:hypothetical protein
VLNALCAIIHVREEDEIFPIHASFHDFLTDRNRCNDSRFFIEPVQHHRALASACLDCIVSHFQCSDTLGIRNDMQQNRDVQENVKLLPGDLTYACRYWPRHVALCELDQSLIDLLNRFSSHNLLYWIECLSLIGGLDQGISSLPGAINILSVCCLLFYHMGGINLQTSRLPMTYPQSCYLMHILLWCISEIFFRSLQHTPILQFI